MSDGPSLREHFADGLYVGEWYVEPMRNRVHLDDEEVQLEPKVMEVLLFLAKRPGKTITKDQFKDEVWRETVVTDDVLSRCISQLRKVFDDDPKDPSYIETIRKTGYRLLASVDRPESTASTPAVTQDRSSTPVEQRSTSSIRDLIRSLTNGLQRSSTSAEDEWVIVAGGVIRRTWLLGLAALLGVLLLFGVVSWLVPDTPSGSGGPPLSALPFTSFSGEEIDPSLSSMGHKVAFAWRKSDTQDQNIYLMQRGAEQPLQLSPDSTTDWSPTWSPDGRFVAYVQDAGGTHHISIVPSIGGQASQTLSLRRRDIQSIAWMPDPSERALVVSAQRRPYQAFALSTYFPDTDSLVTLTSPPLWSTGDTDPAPSPDGSQIAFVRGTVRGVEDIFVIPASGDPPTQVTSDSTSIDGIAWSADGSEILYAGAHAGVSGLWRVDADGGEPTLLRSASKGTRFSHPTVSPQSNRLAYTQTSAQLDIWKLSRPARYEEYETKSLMSSTQEDMHPSIAPGGNQIAFVSNRSGTYEVWIADADGSNPHRLTSLGGPSVRTIRWSPEGKRLCFVTRRKGQSDLYLVSASGGAPTRLTKAPSEDLVPRWSGDGRWVYFSSNRTGNWEAWRTRAAADTHGVEQVTTGGAVAAQESLTDSTLFYVRPDTAGIWTIPLDPNHFPLQTKPGSENLPLNIIVQFDPQERRRWWVGKNGIHFVHRRSNRAVLVYFDFASNRVLPLYEFSDWRPVQSISVGPKGEWFAYTHVVRRESDVMLVENFR